MAVEEEDGPAEPLTPSNLIQFSETTVLLPAASDDEAQKQIYDNMRSIALQVMMSLTV